MQDPVRTSPRLVAYMSAVTLSAGTMIWLFWHYPKHTVLLTLAALVGLGVCARLARSRDVDGAADEPVGHDALHRS